MAAQRMVFRGEVCIDAHCRFCLRAGRALRRWLHRHGFRLRALQAADVARRLGLAQGDVGDQFMLIHADGHAVGGGVAVRDVLRVALGAPAGLLDIPAARRWLDAAYCWAARRWHCREGVCPHRGTHAGQRVRGLAEAIHLGLVARRRPGAL